MVSCLVNYFPGELDFVPDSAVEFAEQIFFYTRLAFKRSLTVHPLPGIFLT